MSKRGSKNAEFLSRNFFMTDNDINFSSGNPREKEKEKEEKKITKKTQSAKLKPDEILSTTQPLRRNRKTIKNIINFKGNKIRRPADNNNPVLISSKEKIRHIGEGDTWDNSKKDEHSHIDYYKNKKRKIAKGIMLNPDRMGRPNKKQRQEGFDEKHTPLFSENN